MLDKKRTKEERESRRAELELFKQRYGLEDFEYVRAWLLFTMRDMINRGEIGENKDGLNKAVHRILNEYPEIDQYLTEFLIAANLESMREMKQEARPPYAP